LSALLTVHYSLFTIFRALEIGDKLLGRIAFVGTRPEHNAALI
jgi:hypothetical protein